MQERSGHQSEMTGWEQGPSQEAPVCSQPQCTPYFILSQGSGRNDFTIPSRGVGHTAGHVDKAICSSSLTWGLLKSCWNLTASHSSKESSPASKLNRDGSFPTESWVLTKTCLPLLNELFWSWDILLLFPQHPWGRIGQDELKSHLSLWKFSIIAVCRTFEKQKHQ